ncbi:MAG: hypothetical protein FWG46_03930 [Treponema sp.]|nr:hypothetical protein [Treponema sp.]
MSGDDILSRLDRIADGIENISEVLNKPESKIKRVLELAGLIAAILAAMTIADIIRKWIVGG